MTAVAFVPVRGGSRAIPGKNLRAFCGRPLLYWCVRAAQEARNVDRVVVATDCDEIARAAAGFGFSKLAIYRRSTASASDTAGTEAVMLEYLDRNPLAADDVFVLLQATSPFTRAADLDRALAQYAAGGADSMLSCVRQRRFYWDDAGMPVNYDPASRPRRQDFAGCWMENGAFYINRAGQVIDRQNRLGGTVQTFEMPGYTGLELDEEDDWLVGEALMRRHGLAGRMPEIPIRMVLTDVDGVLTDGGMYYGECGDELKRFNTLDGKAFELLRERGITTGIVTAERTRLVVHRATKIGADHLFQGVTDKLAVVTELCGEAGLSLDEVAYVGDDLNDLGLLRAVGFSACPSTAVASVKAVVDRVCARGGGEGCLREVADEILLWTAVPADREAHAEHDAAPLAAARA